MSTGVAANARPRLQQRPLILADAAIDPKVDAYDGDNDPIKIDA
jgi:hypothetical protein